MKILTSAQITSVTKTKNVKIPSAAFTATVKQDSIEIIRVHVLISTNAT